MNFRTCGTSVLAVLLAAGAAWGRAARLAEPPPGPIEFPSETFGDSTNVAHLAALLDDPDSTVREQAARDLGETHNELALLHLRRACNDADVNVRCAAIGALAGFAPRHYEPVLRTALADADRQVVLTALR